MNNRISLYSLLAIFCVAIAFGNPKHDQKGLKELNLSDTQKEQFQKISFDTQKKQIEIKAKLETSKLELRRLMTAESIDKSAIEKKMNELSSSHVAMRMNHLNGWIEKNKVLNAEQQKIWKKHLTNRPEKMRNKMMHSGKMRGEMRPPMEREVIRERMRK